MRYDRVIKYVPDMLGGSPVLMGHRVTVENAVCSLQYQTPEAYIAISGFSDWLSAEDLKVVIWYCVNRQCMTDQHFCGNCTLNPTTTQTRDQYVAELDPEYVRDFPEEVETQWQMERNVDGWKIAAKVQRLLGYSLDNPESEAYSE